jgi:hypothetical protein
MGLYEDVVDLATIDQAVLTDTGVAYSTLGALLGESVYLPGEEDSLVLSDTGNVQVHVFENQAGQRVYAMWAKDESLPGETAEGQVAISADGDVQIHQWDYSSTGASSSAAAGTVTIDVTSAVTIVVQE